MMAFLPAHHFCLRIAAAALLLFPGLAAAGDISQKAMRDIRIYIDFQNAPVSGYTGNVAAQEEFRQGARMAMRLWESVFPAMHATFVPTFGESNMTFLVGNYHNRTVGSCGVGGGPGTKGWVGCSYYPNSSGDIAGGKVYFNTQSSTDAPFKFDRFTDFSRQELYESYVPATYRPQGYGDPDLGDGKGWINGQFTARRGGEDATHIIFHEFGHNLNLGHEADIHPFSFYGIPRPRIGDIPTTPQKHYPPPSDGLPQEYYGGGTPEEPWLPDLKPTAIKLHQMADYTAVPGLPTPMLHWFNFRVVSQDMYNYLNPALKQKSIFPAATGLIRLTRGDGSVRLENNWSTAYRTAQLDVTMQGNPFLVNGVYNQGQNRRIAAGASHTLAIRSDGTLWAWGRNHLGQLGDGSQTNRAAPVQIGSASNWMAVVAGESFSMGLRTDNTLWVWGDRTYGQLGDGVTSSTPVLSPKPIGGEEWTAVKAGPVHAIALKTDGSLWGWGYNGYGQLGDGSTSNSNVPVQELHRHQDWVAISAGTLHTLGVKADGTLWAWGWNQYGTLGTGNTQTYNYPVHEATGKTDWAIPEAGHEHSMATDLNGHVWTWGRNQFQQLGAPSSVSMDPRPAQRVGTSRFTKPTLGYWHSGGIRKDGRLWMWGWNSKGQLGANQTLGGSNTSPVQEVTLSTQWIDLHAGDEFTVAQREDGVLWAWGTNVHGQLGTGSSSSTPQNAPVKSLFSYHRPTINLTHSGRRVAPANITLTAQVTGDVKRVEFWKGGVKIGERTAAPWTHSLTGLPVATHIYHARVVDRMNVAVRSEDVPVRVFYFRILGQNTPGANVTLSTEGIVNWKHFPDNNRKSGAQDIGLETFGGDFSTVMVNAPAFHWTTGGTPQWTGSNYRDAATFMNPFIGYGFKVKFPPASAKRIARVYLSATGMDVGLDAVVENETQVAVWAAANGSRWIDVEYHIVDNQFLEVSLTDKNVMGNGRISLQAATVR